MKKLKDWVVGYFKEFTVKRVLGWFIIIVIAYSLMTLGDYFDETLVFKYNTVGYSIVYNLLTVLSVFGAPIGFGVYEVIKIIKNKKIISEEFAADLTIELIWMNSIGLLITSLLDMSKWIIKQDPSRMLNGIEYAMLYILGDIGTIGIALLILGTVIIIRIVKRLKSGKR